MKKRNVAIVLFEDVELLDFAGPYEVFTSVRMPPDRNERLLNVFTVAETPGPIRCRNGLIVHPDTTLEACPDFDILLVPGGYGTRTAVSRPHLVQWIYERSQTVELTTSVCTGSFLLAQAGLLGSKATTTHWGSIEMLRAQYPGLDVRENVRWVDEGNIICSSGVSAGIDMALHIAERLYGPGVARATARGIEYEYWPNNYE